MEKKKRNYNRRYPSDYNIWRTIFYMSFVFLVVIPFMLIFYDYKITGRENIEKRKKSDKLIYTGNHVSYFDPPLVSLACLRPIAYMAKKELFEGGDMWEWFTITLGGFAVDRAKPEIATFKTVKDILSTSWSLGVFPQGGIRPYGKLEDIKKGFAVIAKHAKADIVPVAVADFSGYPSLFPFKRQKVRLHVGTPISYKLPEDVIIYEWCKQISEHANYENCAPIPESYKEKETANV